MIEQRCYLDVEIFRQLQDQWGLSGHPWPWMPQGRRCEWWSHTTCRTACRRHSALWALVEAEMDLVFSGRIECQQLLGSGFRSNWCRHIIARPQNGRYHRLSMVRWETYLEQLRDDMRSDEPVSANDKDSVLKLSQCLRIATWDCGRTAWSRARGWNQDESPEPAYPTQVARVHAGYRLWIGRETPVILSSYMRGWKLHALQLCTKNQTCFSVFVSEYFGHFFVAWFVYLLWRELALNLIGSEEGCVIHGNLFSNR